jgi:hypothetical protein
MLTQLPSVEADQAHSRVAATPTAPDPPVAGSVVSVVFSVIAQRVGGDGAVEVLVDEPQPVARTMTASAARPG